MSLFFLLNKFLSNKNLIINNMLVDRSNEEILDEEKPVLNVNIKNKILVTLLSSMSSDNYSSYKEIFFSTPFNKMELHYLVKLIFKFILLHPDKENIYLDFLKDLVEAFPEYKTRNLALTLLEKKYKKVIKIIMMKKNPKYPFRGLLKLIFHFFHFEWIPFKVFSVIVKESMPVDPKLTVNLFITFGKHFSKSKSQNLAIEDFTKFSEQINKDLGKEYQEIYVKYKELKDRGWVVLKRCEICFDEKKETDFLIMSCQDSFCIECLNEYFVIKIKERGYPIKCPSPSCKTEVLEDVIKKVVSKDDYQRYHKNSLDYLLLQYSDQYYPCLTPNCEMIVCWEKDENPYFFCEKCHKSYCLRCKVEFHVGVSCDTYQKDKKWDNMNQVAIELNAKACPKCKIFIERNKGCAHMTCKCGYEFCFECLEKYPCKTHNGGFAPRLNNLLNTERNTQVFGGNRTGRRNNGGNNGLGGNNGGNQGLNNWFFGGNNGNNGGNRGFGNNAFNGFFGGYN